MLRHLIRNGLATVGIAVFLGCALALTVPAAEKTGRKWQDMDYGPFLTASIETSGPGTNIAFKGIAIRLPDEAGRLTDHAVVFDTDLMRYAAGWSGNFVALKGVVFDGEHWAYPRIDGQQVFGNATLPGWAKAGSFADPRPFIYGPLPREWARWQGLYLHGQQVCLAYTVGDTPVLEMPTLERGQGLSAFARSLQIGAAREELVLQVASEPGHKISWLGSAAVAANNDRAPAHGTIVLLAPDQAASVPNSVTPNSGVIAEWTFDGAGQGGIAEIPGKGGRLRLKQARISPGKTGQGLEFSGAGFAEVAGLSQDPFAHDLTFAAWIHAQGDGTLISQAAPQGPWVPDAKACFIRNGRLTFDVGWVGMVESQRPVPLERWTHVAFTWSHQDGRVALFIDGKVEGSQVLKPRQPLKTHALRLGFSAPNFPAKPFFNGRMDDVRLYGRKLNPAEIATLAGRSQPAEQLAVSLVNGPADARWQFTEDGNLRLALPPHAEPVRCKILIARVTPQTQTNFFDVVRQSPPPSDLKRLTQGGPPRWGKEMTTQGRLGADTGPLAVDTITWPEENPWESWMRFGGLDFFPDGTRAAITTWNGDVWVVSGIAGNLERLTWRRFATGLYQPLGLKIREGQIYVLGRDQITRLHDLNGDGEADWYENFNNDTQNTEHFHEFALDLQTDTEGNFYYMKAARHARTALHPQHGTLMKVSRDGTRSEVVAQGFRAPNGLEVTAQGEFYSTDQEGYWMPANRLNLIKPGRFYGNPWSWFPGGAPREFEPPICWVHPKIDRSPSTMCRVASPQWGPLRDQVLSMSYGVGRIFLVLQEEVNGLRQGGIVPLPVEFETGIMRSRFHPGNGHLYVCGLYGWAGNKTQSGGFYRVRYTGKPLHLPCELHAVTNGLVLKFPEPLDPASAADIGNYSVEAWNYRWTENYGSPDYKQNGQPGRDRLKLESASSSADGRTIYLKLSELRPVMQLHVQMNLKAADGAPIQTYVHSSVHALGPAWSEPVSVAQSPDTAPQITEAPGLAQTFSSRDHPRADTRISRMLALRVPAGTAPTPFLEPGAFTSTWRGYIQLDLSGAYRFHASGRGKLGIRVNGEAAIPFAELRQGLSGTAPVSLKGGLNPIEVTYESPATGNAQLRLFWAADKLDLEPIPPAMLVHDAQDQDLQRGAARRLGRHLFVSRHCHQCHDSVGAFAGRGAEELSMTGSSLNGSAQRFQSDWLVSWMLAPSAAVPETVMPMCLPGNINEAVAQARDIAAFLSTLSPASKPAQAPVSTAPTEAEIKAGETLYATLGCLACHVLPGGPALEPETRRPLAHVRGKWQSHALSEFLQAPTNHYPWTPMPNFQLTAAEAQSLGAYLLSRAAEPPAPVVSNGGSSERGRNLFVSVGCAQCHPVDRIEKQPIAKPLKALAGHEHATGCLAEGESQRGKAPLFTFTASQRQALRQFLAQDVPALARTVLPELANQQIETLRCLACHQREQGSDTWSILEARVAAQQPKQANPYDDEEAAPTTIHRVRPPLSWAGEKLRPEWVERMLLGQLAYKPRPKLPARMPAFPAYARWLAHGMALDHGLDPVSPPPGPIHHDLAQAGQALIQKGALACVDCHEVANQPALAGTDTATINFAHVPDRLRKTYFDRYLIDPQKLLPGTMMPKFSGDEGTTGVTSHFGGDARKQFEAIWHYMLTLEKAPPKGK